MSRYIDADKLKSEFDFEHIDMNKTAAFVHHSYFLKMINQQPTADVVEADKAQKEIDYWHDKAQSYEQTILKLSLNKADVVEVVRCKDCKYWDNTTKWAVCTKWSADPYEQATTEKNDFCSYGEKNE